MFGLHVVRTTSRKEIMKSAVGSCFTIDEGMQILRKHFRPLTNDDDMQISESSIHVTLKSSFSQARINIPARGVACKHINCFDLDEYVDQNLSFNHLHKFKCPHCGDVLQLDDVRSCLLFEMILDKAPDNAVDCTFSSPTGLEGSIYSVSYFDDMKMLLAKISLEEDLSKNSVTASRADSSSVGSLIENTNSVGSKIDTETANKKRRLTADAENHGSILPLALQSVPSKNNAKKRKIY